MRTVRNSHVMLLWRMDSVSQFDCHSLNLDGDDELCVVT